MPFVLSCASLALQPPASHNSSQMLEPPVCEPLEPECSARTDKCEIIGPGRSLPDLSKRCAVDFKLSKAASLMNHGSAGTDLDRAEDPGGPIVTLVVCRIEPSMFALEGTPGVPMRWKPSTIDGSPGGKEAPPGGACSSHLPPERAAGDNRQVWSGWPPPTQHHPVELLKRVTQRRRPLAGRVRSEWPPGRQEGHGQRVGARMRWHR